MIRTVIIRYAQSQIRVKPYNIHGSKKTKWPQQNSQKW